MDEFSVVRQGLADSSFDRYAQMRGLKGINYDYALGGTAASNGHYSDIGKLPNHPTFSVDSAYSNDRDIGGTWDKVLVNGKLVDRYTPSIDMINKNRVEGLAAYMQRVEPNSVLNMPAPYNDQIAK